jgi:hypothetical protein
LDFQNSALWHLEFRTSGVFGMRAEAERKGRGELEAGRGELEEEREDLLDLYVALESYARRRACIDLIAEVDAHLDDDYNAREAANPQSRSPCSSAPVLSGRPDRAGWAPHAPRRPPHP